MMTRFQDLDTAYLSKVTKGGCTCAGNLNAGFRRFVLGFANGMTPVIPRVHLSKKNICGTLSTLIHPAN